MNDINMSIVNYLRSANEVLIKFSEVIFSSLYTSSFGPLAPNLLTPIKFAFGENEATIFLKSRFKFSLEPHK